MLRSRIATRVWRPALEQTASRNGVGAAAHGHGIPKRQHTRYRDAVKTQTCGFLGLTRMKDIVYVPLFYIDTACFAYNLIEMFNHRVEPDTPWNKR